MSVQGLDAANSTVRAAIAEAASHFGVDQDTLAHTIGRESSFDPTKVNPTTGFQGLGQFKPSTWATLTSKYGASLGITPQTSPLDPRAAAMMTAANMVDNGKQLRSILGRAPTNGELYAAHFMGPTGAGELINAMKVNPNAPAADHFGAAARANPSIFYDQNKNPRSLSQVYASLTSEGPNANVPFAAGGGAPNLWEYEPPPSTPKPDLWHAFQEAAGQEQTQVMAFNYMKQLGDPALAPDDNFRWTPDTIKQVTQGLDEKQSDWVIDNAHSLAHGEYLRQQAIKDQQNEADLARYGMWGNLGLRGAAMLTDIPTWLIGAGAGKLAELGQLGRLATAVRAGMIATGEQIPNEMLKMASRPSYGITDALMDSASAFAFGGAFGAAFGHQGAALDNRFTAEAARAEREGLQDTGAQLTDHAQNVYHELESLPDAEMPPPGQDPTEMLAANDHDVRPVDLTADDPLGGQRGEAKGMTSGGAAATDFPRKRGLLDWLDVSVMGSLKRSASPEAADTAQLLDQDLVGDGGASVRGGETAWENVNRNSEALKIETSRPAEDGFRDWATEKGLTGVQAVQSREGFNEQVGRAIYGAASKDASVNRVADVYRNAFAKVLDKAKAGGLDAAARVKKAMDYFPMVFDREKIRAAIAKYGDEGVVSVIKQGLKAASPDLEDGLAQRVAERYLKTVRGVTEGTEGRVGHALTGVDRDDLIQLLTDNGGLSKEDAEAFAEAYRPANKTGPANLRRKATLDSVTKFVPEGSVRDGVTNRAASADDAFSIRDLTDHNAERVFEHYSRSMLGHAAMAKVGFQSEGAFMKHAADVTRGRVGHYEGYTQAAAERDLKNLQYLGKAVLGKPLREATDPTYRKIESIFANVSFSRFMGMTGITHLSGVPKIMSRMGMRAAFDTFHWSDIAGVLRKGGAGADEMARDLEVMTGCGIMGATNRIAPSFEGIEEFYPRGKADKALDYAARWARSAKNLTMMVGGMAPVVDFTRRWAVRASLQRLANIVTGRTTVPTKILNDLGLGAQELERFGQLVSKMQLDGRGIVKNLNVAQLQKMDPEGFDQLGAWLGRMGRTVIVDQSPGTIPRWMGDSPFRLLGQFRGFEMASHAANTLHNIKMGPGYAAQSAVLAGAWGLGIYSLQTYLRSIGRDDQDEYLQKSFSPLKLAAGTITKSGDAGLMPMAFDTAYTPAGWATGTESPFSNARSTGLGASIVGTPVISTADDMFTSGEDIVKALAGRKEWSRQDQQRLQRLVPLNNTYVIGNAMNAMASAFPKESKHGQPPE